MTLLGHALKGVLPTALIGVGTALLVPVVRPAVAPVVRPLTKALVRGGLSVADAVKEAFAETREQVSDLVAEARAEHAGATQPAASASSRPGRGQKKG